MSRVSCTITLYEGRWGRKLSRESLEKAVRRATYGDCRLEELEFVKPDEDVAFEIKASVTTEWSDEENVRDKIIERLLARFEPEYESMVEVEVNDAS
jgi:hypothetical protein